MANVGERDWSFCLHLLSQSVRDSSVPGSTDASDGAVLQALRRLLMLCNEEESGDLVARVYPAMVKVFQRFCSSGSSMRPSHGLILLAVLQYFLDYGESVLHDTDPSLRLFFRSCLSRLFADPTVAKATLRFLNQNKSKILLSHPALLPQFFPLILKIAAWGGPELDEVIVELLPALIGPSSFLPIFPALLDLPTLVLALESLERQSGTVMAGNGAGRKSPAPEALFALMDEAYTGGVGGGGTESGDEGEGTSRDETDALFSDLLKDESEGLPERHWAFPGMANALQVAMGSTPPSERLKHAFNLAPILLQIYFDVAVRDVNDSLLCALLPLVFGRVDAMFPDKDFCLKARKNCIEFVLAAFQQSPQFIAILKKPITDRIGQPHTSTAKSELALQLCWAVGEYGGGGSTYKDGARELFESLELVLYENLSSSRAARASMTGDTRLKMAGVLLPGTPAQARLLCFVVTAIAKLATCHRELSPRARVCLAKVARSHQFLDKAVWQRARDYLGLMHEPAICSSILGSSVGYRNHSTNVQWGEGDTKAVANLPFYLLGEKEGPPFADFCLSDVIKAIAST